MWKSVLRNTNVLTFSLAGFFSDVSQEPALAVLPSFVVAIAGQHAAPFYLGVAMGLSEAFSHIFKLVFGWLSARIAHRKWLVASGYIVEGGFMALIGFATIGWHIVILRAISRIGKGMRTPARDAMLSSSVDESNYGAAFGLQRTGDTFGAVVGIGLLLGFVSFVSDRFVFFFALIPALLAALSIIIWSYDPRGDTPLAHDWRLLPDLWKLSRDYWRFLIIVALFGLTQIHVVVLLLRQYNIAETNGLLASQYAIIIYLFYNIARSIYGYIAGAIGDRFGREVTLAISGYGLFGLSVICMWADIPRLFVSIPIFMILGVSNATIRTLEKSIVAQMLPAYLRDVGYGMLYLVKGFAMLCAGWIIGSMWSMYASWYAFAYIGCMSAIAMITLLLFAYIYGFRLSRDVYTT